MSSHTIILIQYSGSFETRSYLDFPKVGDALDALVKLYEHKLKELNPSVKHIQYDISDLYAFLDSLNDMCGLVFDPSTMMYAPRDRTWLKDQILQHLKRQAK